ncbi:MAG: enoyl-CoA hydratase-related protein [Chlamydiales bacterium]|nr:enoyl-CoA hydratase-related protein [Chlamydiales bacterium]
MDHLQFAAHEDIGVLTINRPEALNALNHQLLKDLAAFLTKKHAIRVLILTGQGDKAFIAGADIREMESMSTGDSQYLCVLGQKVSMLLESAPFVTIAAVNGFALGGGLEMALACDFIYCARKAKLGLPEVSLGLIPGFGGTQRLARAVGTRMAKELIFTGRKITADEAFRIGLVNHVCEDHQLLEICQQTAKEILKNSSASILRAKHVINSCFHLSIEVALEHERQAFIQCFSCPDRQEGIHAFLEKRSPHFEGVTKC